MDQSFSGKELFAPALFFHLEYWLEDVLPRLNTTLSEFEANCENDVENGEVVKFENSGPWRICLSTVPNLEVSSFSLPVIWVIQWLYC